MTLTIPHQVVMGTIMKIIVPIIMIITTIIRRGTEIRTVPRIRRIAITTTTAFVIIRMTITVITTARTVIRPRRIIHPRTRVDTIITTTIPMVAMEEVRPTVDMVDMEIRDTMTATAELHTVTNGHYRVLPMEVVRIIQVIMALVIIAMTIIVIGTDDTIATVDQAIIRLPKKSPLQLYEAHASSFFVYVPND